MNPAASIEHFVIRTVPAMTFAPAAPSKLERLGLTGGLSYWTTSEGALEWRSRVCPLPIVANDPGIREINRLYGFWERKVLPLAGGLYEQPQRYLAMMELFERRLAIARPKGDT